MKSLDLSLHIFDLSFQEMYFIDKWFLKTSSFITQQRYLDVIKALKRIWRYLNVGASVEKGLILPFESYPILSIKRLAGAGS